MAFITREYYKELKENKLIEHGDWVTLFDISKEIGLKKGKGYSAQTFRNVVVDGFTTIPEVVEIVIGYYQPKAESIRQQRLAAQNMKKRLAV